MSESSTSAASSIERQFWLLQKLHPGTRAYHVGSLFRVHGPLDVAALRGAFQDAVERHEALRATFEERDGELVLRVHSDLPAAFEEAGSAPSDEELAAELRRPFDLQRGPLQRVRLWRASPTEWVLSWTMHHAITDLASRSLLAGEIAERYRLRRGSAHPPDRAPAPEPHRAFTDRERGWLASDAARRAEAYFAEQLATPPPPLALPHDRPRPPLQSHRGARVPFELGSELTERLERACAEWRTKPFLALLTAYALLLSRYGDEERLTVGVPFPNRRREESRAAVGCFVNILPVPIDRRGDPTFLDLLRRVRVTLLGHHRHQELPLERIVARCRPERDPGRNPLFQAGFTFEPPVDLALEGAEVESSRAHAGGAQLDVFMDLWRGREGFVGELEYCSDLFREATIERLVRNYRHLLQRALEPAAPAIPVSRLDLVHPSERELVTRAWNATSVSRGAPERLDLMFLEQAARAPDATALRMGARRWSYRELASRARALALQLRSSGVEPGARVGLCMERSFEMVTAMLATTMAGGAYVPIDPEYPAHRVQLVLEDARPSVVLTDPELPGRRWHPEGVELLPVRLDGLDTVDELTPASSSPAEAAYVIFTSGSTGRPKGAANSHRGIANRILWMQEAFRLEPSDVVLQKTPYGFDVSVWEVFWPLCVGAQLEIAPPGAHRDPGALARLIQQAGVTTVHFVPSMLAAFLEHPGAARCRTLRRIVCSGEALPRELARRCCKLLDAELDNLYGPTEAAVDVSWWRCREDLDRDPVPIGRPIANTRLYVLDASGQPVPIGVPGELHIGGVQVALGYVNRPELTSTRFVPDPFDADPDARLYRTGDRVRWSGDGTLEFLGRLDDQVKLRGLRIELGEIEAILEQHPGVRQSAVLVRPLGPGEGRLVAYVVPFERADGGILSGALHAHALAHLPAYMVPQSFVVLDRLPLNANGKVDRRALPEPERAPAPDPRAAPAGELERWLLEQWKELLGLERVGLRDHLFEAGGTSMTAAQLVSRIEGRLGVELPLVRIFEHPTVEALAAHLEAAGARATGPARDPLAAARARGRLRRAQALRRPR